MEDDKKIKMEGDKKMEDNQKKWKTTKKSKMEDDQKNWNGRQPKNSKWKTTKKWSVYTPEPKLKMEDEQTKNGNGR